MLCIHAKLGFRSYIALKLQYRNLVSRSNCPVILVGMMGPRLEISTAVFTDGIYVDKLVSQELYLDAWQSETVLRLGRIFKALSISVAELQDYYVKLSRSSSSEPTNVHLFPNPLPTAEGVRIPKLNYLGKLSRRGELIDIMGKSRDDLQDHMPFTGQRWSLANLMMRWMSSSNLLHPIMMKHIEFLRRMS